MKIEKEGLFIKSLNEGINLFTGAGFSIIPDPKGKYLPSAKDLSLEICREFSMPIQYADNLERLSTLVEVQAKDRFDEYLRKKYTVESYNEIYNNLNLVNIEAYITTNIDNIIQCVMDNSSRYFLNNITLYGTSMKSRSEISFIPLHGNVKDPNSRLYFGKLELANVNEDNPELFNQMFAKLLVRPTLFWGYGFHDSAVESIVAKIITKKKQDIWVQCLPDNHNIAYFRALGCYIIEGTTEELLQWMGKQFSNTNKESQLEVSLNDDKFLRTYIVPTINQLEVVSREDFYMNGRTHWHSVLAGHPYETKSVNDIYEEMQHNSNVVVTGMPLSGKTVALMQLAAKVNVEAKFFIRDFTSERIQLFINKLNGTKATVFVDEFCEDIVAYKSLMENQNISFVGFTDSSSFETTKHLIENISFKKLDFGELTISEAQKIYGFIPSAIRKDQFTYKKDENEKFSMLELMLGNIKGILSSEKVNTILRRLRSNSPEGFEIVALATYLTANNSTLNTEVLISYFNRYDYKILMSWVKQAQDYLSDINVVLEQDQQDQDYYSLRSNLFSYHASKILCSVAFRDDYSSIVHRFIMNVPSYKIYKHYIFKRTAYDASLFHKLFDNNAHDLYQKIYDRDDSAYTLQQWALYKAYLKDFTSAFIDIDAALNLQNNNFSIKNSRAIILFEANKGKTSELALKGMEEAMDILQECYKSDKRKIYHAKKYGEFALYLAENYELKYYLKQANDWLESIINGGYSSTWAIKKLRNDIKKQVY